MAIIRNCGPGDLDAILAVINDAAVRYRGAIAADCWHDPYMSRDELEREVADGVRFRGCVDDSGLAAVMGLQFVRDVALIRHAYTRSARQGQGLGTALLTELQRESDRPVLIGTWAAATWAVRFYERHGFRLVTGPQKDALLRRYWTVPDLQIAHSVVLADDRWFALPAGGSPRLDSLSPRE